MNLNRVLIVGHLTRSPEVRIAQNGTVVARFGVATNSAWTDENGEGEYLRKGQLVLVEGRLRTRSWTTEGVKSSRTDIIAARIQFGQKRPEPSRDTDDLPEENTAPADITDDPNDEIPFYSK